MKFFCNGLIYCKIFYFSLPTLERINNSDSVWFTMASMELKTKRNNSPVHRTNASFFDIMGIQNIQCFSAIIYLHFEVILFLFKRIAYYFKTII